jgi:hypothetical protein
MLLFSGSFFLMVHWPMSMDFILKRFGTGKETRLDRLFAWVHKPGDRTKALVLCNLWIGGRFGIFLRVACRRQGAKGRQWRCCFPESLGKTEQQWLWLWISIPNWSLYSCTAWLLVITEPWLLNTKSIHSSQDSIACVYMIPKQADNWLNVVKKKSVRLVIWH